VPNHQFTLNFDCQSSLIPAFFLSSNINKGSFSYKFVKFGTQVKIDLMRQHSQLLFMTLIIAENQRVIMIDHESKTVYDPSEYEGG
jgi:hypothetical protein